tara:strand:+ start:7626 stop:8774 length:1149 start_codon:yes stop_codon:yes gene_type:complete
MRKFSTKLASRGAFCLGIAVGLSAAGILLGDGALITLGLSALTLMLCCYVMGRCNLSQLEVDISLPNKCHANKPYKPHVVIRNTRSLLDAFHVKLYLAFPHGAVLGSQSAWVPAGSLSSADVPLKIPMRASNREHPYKFCSTFPLGIFRFSSRQLLLHPLTIYPRSIIPDELLDHGVFGQCQSPNQHSNNQHSGEPRSIRPWQPGDAAKSIHWPASIRSLAQGHSLRVREFDPPGLLPEQAVVIFHSFSAHREMMREDAFERAISLTAGTIAHLRNLNIRTTLVADFMHWHPIIAKTRPQYYECLSILADTQRAIGTELHELQSALDEVSDEQQIIIISDMPPEAWQDLILIPASATVIDIRQVNFPFKKTISAKEALSQSA